MSFLLRLAAGRRELGDVLQRLERLADEVHGHRDECFTRGRALARCEPSVAVEDPRIARRVDRGSGAEVRERAGGYRTHAGVAADRCAGPTDRTAPDRIEHRSIERAAPARGTRIER